MKRRSPFPVCVVGKLVEEHGSLKEGEDGKKYFNKFGVDYEVVGHIGVEEATDLDNMVILNLICFNKEMQLFSTYYIDSADPDAIESLKNNFAASPSLGSLRSLW